MATQDQDRRIEAMWKRRERLAQQARRPGPAASEPKPGLRTTEFWLTAVSNIAGAILALLAAYGLLDEQDQALWLSLLQTLAVVVIPLALAQVNAAYIRGRADVKRERGRG